MIKIGIHAARYKKQYECPGSFVMYDSIWKDF
jgi:hypothetical protein